MRNIVFIVGTAIYNGDGYKSRIMMEIDILKKYHKLYILLPEYKNIKTHKDIEFGNDVIVLKYNTYSGLIGKIKSLKAFKNELLQVKEKINNPVYYCESLMPAFKTSCFLKKKDCIVFDCHGSEADEFYLYHNNLIGKGIYYILKMCERKVINNSKLIITVTEAQYYKWNITKKYLVLPMLPSKHFFDVANYRREIRNKLNIPNDKIVYVYSGSDAKWQLCKETIRYYKEIENNQKNTFLLILTQNKVYFEELLIKENINSYKVCKVNYLEMPAYLDACDFGFCLRNDSIVNRVASPTKVLEYLARNVKPILTEFVGDFSRQLGNYACVIDINKCVIKIYKETQFNGKNFVKCYQEEKIKEYLKCIDDL